EVPSFETDLTDRIGERAALAAAQPRLPYRKACEPASNTRIPHQSAAPAACRCASPARQVDRCLHSRGADASQTLRLYHVAGGDAPRRKGACGRVLRRELLLSDPARRAAHPDGACGAGEV